MMCVVTFSSLFAFTDEDELSDIKGLRVVSTWSKSSNMDAKARMRDAGAFRCSACDMYFMDSGAVAAHKASKRHRQNIGEIEREKLRYKPDADVTVNDVQELVARKKVELGVMSFAEIVYRPNKRTERSDEALV